MSIEPVKLRPAAIQELKAPLPVHSDPNAAIKQLFQSDEAYATSLVAAAMKFLTFDELATFAPATIRLELQDALALKHIDNDIFGRLMAGVVIVTSDLFYKDLPSFIELCNVLSGMPGLVEVFDPADAYEVAWGVAESMLLDGMDGREDSDEFSEEIRVYMGAVLAEEGFFAPPAFLPMAIFEGVYDPAASFADSEDILPAIVERDIARQQDMQDMMTANMRALISQLKSINPEFLSALKPV